MYVCMYVFMDACMYVRRLASPMQMFCHNQSLPCMENQSNVFEDKMWHIGKIFVVLIVLLTFHSICNEDVKSLYCLIPNYEIII